VHMHRQRQGAVVIEYKAFEVAFRDVHVFAGSFETGTVERKDTLAGYCANQV
jgi:hypothetical protein